MGWPALLQSTEHSGLCWGQPASQDPQISIPRSLRETLSKNTHSKPWAMGPTRRLQASFKAFFFLFPYVRVLLGLDVHLSILWMCYTVLVRAHNQECGTDLEPVAFCASQPRPGLATADLCPLCLSPW